ncbi:hypothetical protein [Streptomyces sp.]
MSEPPLVFAAGLFLVALGLLLAVLTPWLTRRPSVPPLRLPARRPPTAARHRVTAPARAAV